MPTPDILKVAGMLVRDRKTLVVRSEKDAVTFMTAGGKPEPGESEHDALVRELAEELGIIVNPASGVHKFGTYTQEAFNKPGKIVQIDAYVIAEFSGEPTPQAEIAEIKWVNSVEATDMELASVVKHHIIPKMAEEGIID